MFNPLLSSQVALAKDVAEEEGMQNQQQKVQPSTLNPEPSLNPKP
jgi:hypothetical protein